MDSLKRRVLSGKSFDLTTETTVLEPDAGERAQTAAELLASVIDDSAMAALAAQARGSGLALMGEGALLRSSIA